MKFAARLAAHFALASLFTLVMAGQTTPSPSPSAPDQAASQEQTAQQPSDSDKDKSSKDQNTPQAVDQPTPRPEPAIEEELALTNVFREYWPDIATHVFHRHP